MRSSDRVILLLGSELASDAGLQLELQARGLTIEVANFDGDSCTPAVVNGAALLAAEIQIDTPSNIRLLSALRKAKPNLPFILTTGKRNAETAIEAAKLEAQCVTRPFQIPHFVDLVCELIGQRVAQSESDCGSDRVSSMGLIGSGPAMEALYTAIGRAAKTPWGVLLRGATGTGKELVARAIHNHSDRADHPFVPVNCCAVPESLFESELFGHEAGAFTGAHGRRIGCFEQAQKGTVFLDEIGDLNPAAQAKLLRVLQEKQVRRLGSYRDIAVDVRVVAATNRNLEKRVATGDFREDLFYRLAVCTINTPELREHPEDIPALAIHFLACAADDIGGGTPLLDEDAVAFLKGQPWLGNVRQLENVIRRAALDSGGKTIRFKDVEQAYAQGAAGKGPDIVARRFSDLLVKAQSGEIQDLLRNVHEETESALIREMFAFTAGNITRGAALLGVGRNKYRDKLKELGLWVSEQPRAFERPYSE